MSSLKRQRTLAAHPGREAQYSRKYRLAHPGRASRNHKRWYQLHPTAKSEYRLRYLREKPARAGFNVLKSSAKSHNRQCTITFEEYQALREMPCFYCGGPLPERGHGVDRINSAAGYVTGNVRPCCTQCNLAKGKWSEITFRDWLVRVYTHWAVDAGDKYAAV